MAKLLHIGLPTGTGKQLKTFLTTLGASKGQTFQYPAGGEEQFKPEMAAGPSWSRTMLRLGSFEFGIKENDAINTPLEPSHAMAPTFSIGSGRKATLYTPGEAYPFRVPRHIPGNDKLTIRLPVHNPTLHQHTFGHLFGPFDPCSPKIKFTKLRGKKQFGNVHYKFALAVPDSLDTVLARIPNDWTLAVPPTPFQATPTTCLTMTIIMDDHGYEWVLTQ